MKRKDTERGPHLVPIPPRLLAQILEWRRADGEAAEYVLPAPRGGGSVTCEGVQKFYRGTLNLTGKHSPHSWRAVLSTWANDAGEDADVVEAQLDQVTGTPVKTTYDRAQRLDRRADLMKWHEDALIAARDGAKVLDIARGRRPMNTVARAWQAAITGLKEARDLHESGGDAETVRDLLGHAREMIEIIEEEINSERERFPDPDVVRMAAAELRKRVDAAATLVPLH